MSLRLPLIVLVLSLSFCPAFSQTFQSFNRETTLIDGQRADNEKLTKSLQALYPNYPVILSEANGYGFPPQSMRAGIDALRILNTGISHLPVTDAIVSTQPKGATDEQLLERAVNYARTLFLESDSTSANVFLNDPTNKEKFVLVQVYLKTLKRMATGAFRPDPNDPLPKVLHFETDSRLADGPLKFYRTKLLKKIEDLRRTGVDVTECSEAFWALDKYIKPDMSVSEVYNQPNGPSFSLVMKMVAKLSEKPAVKTLPSARELLSPFKTNQ